MADTRQTKAKKHRAAIKTGIDHFWYFLVLVLAFVFILYTNAISFDDNEYKIVREFLPWVTGVLGISAYRTIRQKQRDIQETVDGENCSRGNCGNGNADADGS